MSKKDQSLFDIAHDLRALMDKIIEAGGEITDEQDERYDALQDAAVEKTEAYIVVMRELKAEVDQLKELAKHYKEKAKSTERSISRMKDALLWSMEVCGDEVRDTAAGKARVMTASRRSVEVHVDAEDLPAEFRKVSVRPDKRRIKERMKGGGVERITVNGEPIATLKPATRYVRIY